MSTNFELGGHYTRRDVLRAVGLPEDIKGGNWFTGYQEHAGVFYIFANVGAPGRTGHDYRNAWEGSKLRWFAKGGTKLSQPQIKRMLQETAQIRVFWRSRNDSPFTYAGDARAEGASDASSVEIVWVFDAENDDSAR